MCHFCVALVKSHHNQYETKGISDNSEHFGSPFYQLIKIKVQNIICLWHSLVFECNQNSCVFFTLALLVKSFFYLFWCNTELSTLENFPTWERSERKFECAKSTSLTSTAPVKFSQWNSLLNLNSWLYKWENSLFEMFKSLADWKSFSF